MLDVEKKTGQKNIYLQSMKGNRVSVCIVKMEMYCENGKCIVMIEKCCGDKNVLT